MTKIFKFLAAGAVAVPLSVAAASAHQQTLIYAAGPAPQGHPFLVKDDGVVVIYPAPRRPLQYGLIDGRRVLVDPLTLRVVYYLQP